MIFIAPQIFCKNPSVERYCALCISYVNVCDPRDDLKAEALLSCCSCSSGLGYYSPPPDVGHNVILTVWDVVSHNNHLSCSPLRTLNIYPFFIYVHIP